MKFLYPKGSIAEFIQKGYWKLISQKLEKYKNDMLSIIIGDDNMKYNIIENLDDYVIEIMAVGFNKEDIEVRQDGNKIIVFAEQQYPMNTKYKVKQFSFDKINLEIELEKQFDITRAMTSNGMLIIFAEKKEKTKRIEIENS